MSNVSINSAVKLTYAAKRKLLKLLCKHSEGSRGSVSVSKNGRFEVATRDNNSWKNVTSNKDCVVYKWPEYDKFA